MLKRERNCICQINSFERCLSFINCQLNPSREALRYSARVAGRMAVTISRQTGSGAMAIAQHLMEHLQAKCPCACPWTVFDRNLMDKVLEEHHLPAHVAKFLPEDSISGINDAVEELLGLHPSSWTVMRQTAETILHLVEVGCVVIVGRAANVVTQNQPNCFHVRLVAPLEKRIHRIQQQNQLTEAKAKEFIERTDRGRARYLKKNYGADIDDPLLYDMSVNTDRFAPEDVAQMIGEAVLKRRALLREAAGQPALAG